MDEPTHSAAFVAGLGGEELPRLVLVHLDDPGFAHLLRLLDLHIHLRLPRQEQNLLLLLGHRRRLLLKAGSFPRQRLEEERRKSQAV
jgi:hypothetical protein